MHFRPCTKNSKQIFPEKKLGMRPRSLVSGNTLHYTLLAVWCLLPNQSKSLLYLWLEMSGQIFSPKVLSLKLKNNSF